MKLIHVTEKKIYIHWCPSNDQRGHASTFEAHFKWAVRRLLKYTINIFLKKVQNSYLFNKNTHDSQKQMQSVNIDMAERDTEKGLTYASFPFLGFFVPQTAAAVFNCSCYFPFWNEMSCVTFLESSGVVLKYWWLQCSHWYKLEHLVAKLCNFLIYLLSHLWFGL